MVLPLYGHNFVNNGPTLTILVSLDRQGSGLSIGTKMIKIGPLLTHLWYQQVIYAIIIIKYMCPSQNWPVKPSWQIHRVPKATADRMFTLVTSIHCIEKTVYGKSIHSIHKINGIFNTQTEKRHLLICEYDAITILHIYGEEHGLTKWG